MNKQEFLNETSNRIERLNGEIDKLQEMIQRSPYEANYQYSKMVASLDEKREVLENKVNTLKNNADVAYSELKAGLEMAYDDLATTVKQVKNQITGGD